MVMKFQTIVLLSLVCFVLLPLKIVYGAAESFNDDSTLLAQAQSKLENETRYLNTLINYTKSHNITMVSDPEVIARIIHLSGFEEMVKKHLEYCKDKPAGPIPGEPFYKLWWKSNGGC
jgi:hypothetical protein